MSKRTIGADGLDELPKPRPGWFVVTVKDSEGMQVGYAYAHSGERFELSDDGQLIRVAMTPVDKSTEGQVER